MLALSVNARKKAYRRAIEQFNVRTPQLSVGRFDKKLYVMEDVNLYNAYRDVAKELNEANVLVDCGLVQEFVSEADWMNAHYTIMLNQPVLNPLKLAGFTKRYNNLIGVVGDNSNNNKKNNALALKGMSIVWQRCSKPLSEKASALLEECQNMVAAKLTTGAVMMPFYIVDMVANAPEDVGDIAAASRVKTLIGITPITDMQFQWPSKAELDVILSGKDLSRKDEKKSKSSLDENNGAGRPSRKDIPAILEHDRTLTVFSIDGKIVAVNQKTGIVYECKVDKKDSSVKMESIERTAILLAKDSDYKHFKTAEDASKWLNENSSKIKKNRKISIVFRCM